MTNYCRRCFSDLKEGQRVSVVMSATYHMLKSRIAYALDKTDMEADAETIVHAKEEDCVYEEDWKV